MTGREGNRWMRVLLLAVLAVASSSCTRELRDDPEGRGCIRVERGLEIPPRLCPLERENPYPDAPADEMWIKGQEWVNCVRDGKTARYYEYCPAGTAPADTPQPLHYHDCSTAPPAPYWVPQFNKPQDAAPHLGPTAWVKSEIEKVMLAVSEQTYTAISEAAFFRKVLMAMATLAISLYGVSVTLQFRPTTVYDAMMLVIKIVFVMGFIYHWDFFRDVVYNSFEDNPTTHSTGIISALTNAAANAGNEAIRTQALGSGTAAPDDLMPDSNYDQSTNTYTQLDAIFATVYGWNFQKFMLAIWTSGWMGPLYFLLMSMLVFAYTRAVIAVMQAILLALLGRTFLYALAPLFIMCLLLKHTSQIFHNWLEVLLSFSLQPVFLGVYLGLMLGIMTMLFDAMLISNPDIKLICYTPLITTSYFVDWIQFWQFADIHGNPVERKGLGATSVPLNLYIIATVILLSDMSRGISEWLVTLAKSMTKGSISAMGSIIPAEATLMEYAKVPLAGAGGAVSGFFTGAADSNGVTRGAFTLGGALRNARSKMNTQMSVARARAAKDFENFGANQ